MPKKIISVCANCGKKSCDGALWIYVKMIQLKFTDDSVGRIVKTNEPGAEVNLATIPKENMVNCSLGYGMANYKMHMMNKKVGDEVVLTFFNWAVPSIVTIKKIED